MITDSHRQFATRARRSSAWTRLVTPGRPDEALCELLLEPVGLATDVKGDRVPQEPVKDGGGEDAIAEHVAPNCRNLITDQDFRPCSYWRLMS